MGKDQASNSEFEHYRAHINERVAETDFAYPEQLEDDHASCCCIDGKAAQTAEHVFAGGAVRLFLELGKNGFLKLLDKWADKGGVLKAHMNCGWMLLIRNMTSKAAQTKALHDFETTVNEWNAKHHDKPGFTVEIAWVGTAEPYMTN
ncbi:MAG TPA: hypothetical protein VFG51_03105 [Candidatus Saccharimonadia bacterium]|nr:hypothetical protein [Candidatus Saccharimonadia bacterium]